MTQSKVTTASIIAKELNVSEHQVDAAIQLLDDGATVPFIARYRKEATNGLDDSQLRNLSERLYYIRELDDRRQVIIQSIKEQEKLTPELEKLILNVDTKTQLEDLYLPYRPKRRTKALQAREAGLEPLALNILEDPTIDPTTAAASFLNPEANIDTVEKALEGARQILMEMFAEHAGLLSELRSHLWKTGTLMSKKAKTKNASANKYADYFEYQEPIHKIPSHRALALFRGRRESVLQLSLALLEDQDYGIKRIAAHFNISEKGRTADEWLMDAVNMAWKVKVFTKLELELLAQLRESADEEAINVFASNLRDLLLAAPAGPKVTLGLDPGIRTGVKAVAIDETGRVLDYTTIYPFAPQNEWHQSIASIAKIAAKHKVELISVGNGTASRDTDRLVAELIKMYPDLNLTKLIVNEAGASVYSASELASKEFPDLDVTIRGAVSIARRLQDPLAELVKIEPKSIGVGQYQHDVNLSKLSRSLEAVVEDCVNAVGVDVNTASVSLLTRVSGFNESLAKNLVEYRNTNGAFTNRDELKNVTRMGEKAFQQSAGFLRIMQGENPLDASAVHPEAYPLIESILSKHNTNITELMGDRSKLESVNAADFVDEHFGLPTIKDVLSELEKPGRDPRPEFKTASFKEGVEDIKDLNEGMLLEGVVSNVTNFGAFVDIGVHQDGLVHISALTNKFVSDPRTVVKAGQIVMVKVLEVDKERRRISLTMRLDESSAKPPAQNKQDVTSHPADIKSLKNKTKRKKPQTVKQNTPPAKKQIFNTSMADALAKLKGKAQ
jgi:protein Tex